MFAITLVSPVIKKCLFSRDTPLFLNLLFKNSKFNENEIFKYRNPEKMAIVVPYTYLPNWGEMSVYVVHILH